MHRINYFHLLLYFLGGIVLLFILAPLIGLFINSSSLELFETIQDKEVTSSIWLTLWTSLMATIFFAISAIPLAYLLAKKKFPMKRLINGIIDIPVVIPHSAAGIALLGFISRDTFLGSAAEKMGISLVGNPIGIALAMAFVSVPFLINSARDGFSLVPDRLEKAALSLGASPMQVFLTVSLPLALRNIVSGLIMMFARGMSEFGAVIIIAYHPMVTPILIFERFNSFGLSYARPVAIVFIIICLLFFIALRLLTKNKQNVRS
jgi:molybdate/tungstate transport system permease protein